MKGQAAQKKQRRDAAMRALAERRMAEIRLPVDKDAGAKIERFDFKEDDLTPTQLPGEAL